ncbi:MATH domain and coiled-coil domain-containing protein At3g58360-like [Trifolium pratense]|uniref:MATH domain and coiled-coil domain-containing protein At3g58360-like n=1 Tax=Trifolium pratense TaxID=57577 RepID=UPI001E690258|nr:MATH domain and coiled-coil domain-containing protein At3g58360-like [Trifolium pratense]
MERGQSSVEKYEKFTWKIENFSRFNIREEVYSEPFVLGGYPWMISLFPRGDGIDDHLSIYLEAVQMQTNYANMSNGWSRDVKFKLVVFNQLDSYMNITLTDGDLFFPSLQNARSNDKFNSSATSLGYKSCITLDELYDPNNGFIVNDSCIVGAEVFVCESTPDEPVIQAANLCSTSPTGYIKVEVPMPNPEVEGSKEDSTKDADAELVSAALGRVLYFLKTRKVKDMNEQACKELQVLWDELKKFQFDLTWLEPHVQSALGMKSFVEKSLHVEKLKEDMVVLKEKLSSAEVNLDGEIDLLKEKGFKEIGLDSELGCGSWRP